MKTVLSIDLDILMAPYCGIYNRYIRGDDRDRSWTEAKSEFEIYDFKVNSTYKQVIKTIINTYKNKVNKIYVGEDHSTILTAIKAEQFNISDLNVINIDYHHDINYNVINRIPKNRLIEAFQQSAVSSWGGWLIYNGSKFNWYYGEGSSFNKNFFMFESAVRLTKDNFSKCIFDSTFPLDLDIDLLYIVPSLPWIPQHCESEITEVLDTLDKDKIVYLRSDYLGRL